MGNPTVMTPERVVTALRLAAKGMTQRDVAAVIGVSTSSVNRWAKAYKIAFADGRKASRPSYVQTEARTRAGRANIAKAIKAATEARRLPLTDDEMRRYRIYREKGRTAGVPITRADALRAIGRPDLAGARP